MGALLEMAEARNSEGEVLPSRRKWTHEEYYELFERGFFEGQRVELIDGEILTMSPMNDPHAFGIMLTLEALRQSFVGDFTFRPQMPMVLLAGHEPEPDIAILKGTIRENPKHPSTALLIVEVSESSFFYDTTVKAKIYAEAGVPDYWVLDLKGRRLRVFREPNATGYTSQKEYFPNESIAPLAAPSVPIRVADLLP